MYNKLPSSERVYACSSGPDVQMICGPIGKKGNVEESCESVRVRSGNETVEFAKPKFTSSGKESLGYSVQWGDCYRIKGEIRRGNIEYGVLRMEYNSGEL